MKEMQGIKNEFEALAKRLAKPDEVGTIELGKIFEDLKNLDNRANITANSFARNSQNDINEVREVLNIWNDLQEDIRVKLVDAKTHHDSKKALLDAKFAEYRKVKGYKRDVQKSINEHKFERDKHKALLNHISDPFAKDNMQDTIRDDDKHITKAELLNNRYDSEIANLEAECLALLNGGKIKNLEVVEEEEMLEEINRDTNKKSTDELDKTEELSTVKEPENEIKPLDTFIEREKTEDTFINPFTTEPVKVKYEESYAKEENNGQEPVKDEPDFLFIPPEYEETKKHEEWPDMVPEFFKETKVEPIVEKPKKDEEPANKRVLPPPFEVDEEENIKVEAEKVMDAVLDESVTPVAAIVVQPKQSLWAKINKVIKNAMDYLSGQAPTHNTEKIKKIAKEEAKPKNTDLNANTEIKKEEPKKAAPETEEDWYKILTENGLSK